MEQKSFHSPDILCLLSTELTVLWQKISKYPATNLDNFWLLVLICNVSTLVPLVLIGWIPAGDPGSLKKPVVAGLSRGEDEDLRRLP